MSVPVGVRSKTWVCGCLLAGIAAGGGMVVRLSSVFRVRVFMCVCGQVESVQWTDHSYRGVCLTVISKLNDQEA
jgi:hypothetical protein